MPEGARRKRILLVEDERIVAMSGKISLERRGYEVVISHSGEHAVETVRNDDAIDLILMDIDLGPGIDGTEAARTILTFRDLPVVFLSSHTEPEIVERTEKITSYGYVVKNSNDTVLDASIKMAFKLFHLGRKLAESTRKYQELFEHNNSAVALHEMIYDDTGKPVDYRFIAVNPAFEEITGLKAEAVENTLHERQEQFRALAENAPDIVALFDRELRHVYINSTIEGYAGIPREQYIGKTNQELGMPAELVQLWNGALEEVFRTGEVRELCFSYESGGGPVDLQ